MQIITNRKIRIGILGCGRISVKHIEAILMLNKDLELVAVCDIDLKNIKKSFLDENVRLFSSIEDMLKLKLDLVSICTPSGLHAEHSLICSQYNTNVITEKPMAIKLLDAKKND
ncbi:Gfo/Idh/MocA family oxidoreductase [Pelagibacteraceae bacterium]|nr:Gfo/Idh/MocA family oxidoreductase [Pelagibacteraceae bacterium]